MKTLLHLGAGRLHAPRDLFPPEEWWEVRVDLSPEVEPDIVADVRDLSGHVTDGSVDAIFAAHLLEHLPEGGLLETLGHWRALLKPDGRLLIHVPDIHVAAQWIAEGRGCAVMYYAPSDGEPQPVRPLDLIYGHAMVSAGEPLMCHKTGFTCSTLGWWLGQAGFEGEIHYHPGHMWTIVADVRRNGRDVPDREPCVLIQKEPPPVMESQPEQPKPQPAPPGPGSQAQISEQVDVQIVDPDE